MVEFNLKRKLKKANYGITLIALVITIIILLILAGVTIATLTGDNGIVTKAQEAKLKTELATIQEELELFKVEKMSESIDFVEDSLTANKELVSYSPKTGDEQTIYDIIPSLKGWAYEDNIEISKGELIFVSQENDLLEIAKKLGLTINPYLIKDGELQSSETNLALMDSTGTLTIPSTVTKIGEGAFRNLKRIKNNNNTQHM